MRKQTIATQMVRMADSKSRVTGTYYGKPFSGTVVFSRQISMRPYPEQVTIELDSEIIKPGNHKCGDAILLWSSDVGLGGDHSIDQLEL